MIRIDNHGRVPIGGNVRTWMKPGTIVARGTVHTTGS